MDRVKPEDRAFYKNFNERSFNTSIPVYRSRVCTMRLEGLAAIRRVDKNCEDITSRVDIARAAIASVTGNQFVLPTFPLGGIERRPQ